MKKISIVEDDRSLAKELRELLENNGYTCHLVEDFSQTLESIISSQPDLVLLDINIPYMNGSRILEKLRETSDVPVIMVTSRNSEVDEALSITRGADDYIVKPYNPNILLLRIEAVLRRTYSQPEPKYDGIEIDLQRGILKNSKMEITLTKNEVIIFSTLLNRRGQLVTRDELMTVLWDNSEYINDNALTVNISRLRSKLSELDKPDAIDTRKGLGYILT